MIIRNVRISNYKTYLNLDLDLTVKSDRPIILIGGRNGGGKTTLFEAICGALYGLKIKDKSHFQELLNNGAVGRTEPTIVLEVTFEGQVLGQTQKYLLRRTYKLNPQGKPVESVMLNLNGTQFVYGTASSPAQRALAEPQINKIIKANLPQELSKYFLFDAMQSSELLKENVFAQIIKDNIENVMGFNKYIQLKRASERIKEEQSALKLTQKQEAEEYNELCAQKAELQELQDENIKRQDLCYKRMSSLSDDYNKAKEGAKVSKDAQAKINQLEASVHETEEMNRRYNLQLKEVVESLEMNVFFPKLAAGITHEVDDIIRKKEVRRHEREGVLTPEQLRDVTGKIVDYLRMRLQCTPDVKESEIVDHLLSVQNQVFGEDPYAFLDDSELDALKRLVGAKSFNGFIQLNDARHDLEKRIDNYDMQLQTIDTLRRSLQGGDAEIIRDYEQSASELETLKKDHLERDKEITRLERRIQNYDVQVSAEPDVKYETLLKLRPFFEDVADELLKRKKTKIEEEMKSQLNQMLLSYKGCISKVELSPSMKDFSIRLFHKADNEISLNQLNAASKQIFIQVLLKVLRNLGDYNPPVMIDTVMGVLDEESREVLMEEYFPGLAEQTILLCTTSEIRPDSDYRKLEPFVSRTYTLNRDVETQSTDIEDGYFGKFLED